MSPVASVDILHLVVHITAADSAMYSHYVLWHCLCTRVPAAGLSTIAKRLCTRDILSNSVEIGKTHCIALFFSVTMLKESIEGWMSSSLSIDPHLSS